MKNEEIQIGKVYKAIAIMMGTFWGGPLVAGYMIANNFKQFGESCKVKKTWLYTIIVTLVIYIGGTFLMPDQIKLFSTFCSLIVYFLVQDMQGKRIELYMNTGGKVFSWWNVILIGLIGMAATLFTVFSASVYLTYY